jgi:hypothetical protein
MLKRLKSAPGNLIIALLLALPAANTIFTHFIQHDLPFISRSSLALASLVLVVLTLAIYALIEWVSSRRIWLREIDRRKKIQLFLVCFLLTVYLVALLNTNKTTNAQKNELLYPIQTIEINVPVEKDARSSGYTIELVRFDNQFGYTSYSQFAIEGEWTRTDRNAFRLENPEQPAGLRWQGRTGENAEIAFRTGPDAGKVQIGINNGELETINLSTRRAGEKTVVYDFPPSLLDRAFAIWFQFNLIIVPVYLLVLYASTLPWAYPRRTTTRKGAWLLYALPMLLSWGLCLLTLMPGLIGSDSIAHFRQAWYGGDNEWHAVLDTLLLAGLTTFTRSPAIVAAFQILCLALTVAWGLRFFDRTNTPRWVPWLISVMMALSLPVAFNVITIWKDIPYSIAVLALTLFLLFTIHSDGKWLDRKGNVIALGLVSVLIILLRQNGLLVPIASFIVLVILYRERWEAVLASFAITLVSYLIFTGPVYQMLKVDTETYKVNAIIVHHLGAHINAGTPLTKEEADFLYKVMPASQWAQYDCTLHNILWYQTDVIDRDYYNQNSLYGLRILARWFLAAPGVVIDHILCASSMVWSPVPKAYFMESAFRLPNGKWVVNNDLGIVQKSFFPRLAAWLYTWHTNIDQGNLIVYILVWRPALRLYAAIILGIVLAIRRRERRYLYILTPLLVHSLTLFMVNVAQDLRYQFPAYLIAPFFLGFLFVPGAGKNQEDHVDADS